MKLTVVAVGQRQPAWADTACEDYLKRFPPDWKVEVKALKAEIEATGQDRIIGEDADVIVSLQERKGNIDEKLLARFMSPDEIASCRKESSVHPVLRIKAKCKA